MAHRIRYTMTQEPLSSKLQGVIEVDETYVGGKLRVGTYKPKDNYHRKRKAPVANKAAVVSVLQRGGRVQSTHVEQVTAANLKEMVNTMIDESAHVITDSSTVLEKTFLGRREHSQVNHTAKEYVRYEDGLCIHGITMQESVAFARFTPLINRSQ